MSSEPADYFCRGLVSDCCQMPVMDGDMCSHCKEHCIPEVEMDAEDEPMEPKK